MQWSIKPQVDALLEEEDRGETVQEEREQIRGKCNAKFELSTNIHHVDWTLIQIFPLVTPLYFATGF